MKIVIYGDTTTPGTGGWCYAETLKELGHDIIQASDEHLLSNYLELKWRLVRKAFGRPLERHRRCHAKVLTELVQWESPQIVLILKGLHISRLDVELMKGAGSWVAIINHDDFFSKNPHNWSVAQRTAIPAYDFIFVTREVNVEEIRPLNPNVEFLPFAYYPRIHRPFELSATEVANWGADVSFVGTWEKERSSLLEYLVSKVDARYAIWGGQWKRRISPRSPLKPFIRGDSAMMDDLAKAIAGSQISLGFLRKKNRDLYTQRSFEIPACGGLFLGERTPVHQKMYREGIEAEFFDPSRPQELVEKVKALLRQADRREQIRKAGSLAVAHKAATYRDRMNRLLAIYDGQCS